VKKTPDKERSSNYRVVSTAFFIGHLSDVSKSSGSVQGLDSGQPWRTAGCLVIALYQVVCLVQNLISSKIQSTPSYNRFL